MQKETDMPKYPIAVSVENSSRILEALANAGGVATFSEIEATSDVIGSVLTHHLNRLQKFNVIQRETKGTYRLRFKTPFCFLFETKQKVPISYLGLLGQRESRTEPEPQVALGLLEKEHLKPDLVYVVTSPEALNDWKDLKLPYHWILCYDEEIINVDLVKTKITPQLLNLLENSIVVMDCTSATKPATIAYYELAQTYYIPLVYIYEETKQMKWLLSKETIKRELGMI
jgi:hypothetical protein